MHELHPRLWWHSKVICHELLRVEKLKLGSDRIHLNIQVPVSSIGTRDIEVAESWGSKNWRKILPFADNCIVHGCNGLKVFAIWVALLIVGFLILGCEHPPGYVTTESKTDIMKLFRLGSELLFSFVFLELIKCNCFATVKQQKDTVTCVKLSSSLRWHVRYSEAKEQ